MSYLHKILTSVVLAFAATTAMANQSILDIKHSITDNDIVPPESFETKTRELEQNFYLSHFTEPAVSSNEHRTGTDEEYEELLSKLPVEIEMPFNSVVGSYINMYIKRHKLIANMLALHSYYGPMFIEELLKADLPLELQYLPVIESAINPNAVSRVGACGLWQFMPATARGLGMEINSLVDERRDPRVSTKNAVRYLKQLYDIYGDWSLAIAAYNCGPGNVNKAMRRAGGGKLDFWEIYNYLPRETRGYVPAFIAANYVMTYHKRYGINPTVVKNRLVTDTVQVNDRIYFKQIADVIDIPVEEIKMLNPQYRKDVIPGDHRPYLLVLPMQKCYSYIVSEDAIKNYDADAYARRSYVEPGQSRTDANALVADEQSKNAESNEDITMVAGQTVQQIHKVTRGESLREIAKHYGVSSTDIKRWNNLRRGKVKEGDELVINIVKRDVAGASTSPTGKSTVTDTKKKSSYTASAQEKSSSKAKSKSKKQKQEKAKKPTTYKIKKGDNLYVIARKHGTTVAAIKKANGMKSDKIDVGKTLKIPTDSKSTSKSKKSSSKKSSKKKKR